MADPLRRVTSNGLFAFACIVLQLILPTAAEPVLIVHWSSDYHTKDVLRPFDNIRLDASLSYNNGTNDPLFYFFRFGTETFRSKTPIYVHSFPEPGIYQISVYISDQDSYMTKSNLPAPFWTRFINIQPCDCCLKYVPRLVNQTDFHVASLEMDHEYTFECYIVDQSNRIGSSPVVLGNRFHMLGEYPTLVFADPSIHQTSPWAFDPTQGIWRTKIHTLSNITTTQMTIKSQGVNIMSECISPTYIDVSISSVIDSTLRLFDKVTEIDKDVLNKVKSIRRSMATCATYTSITLLSSFPFSRALGENYDAIKTKEMAGIHVNKYALFTSDGNGPNTVLVDVVGSPNINGSICQLVGEECNSILVTDVQMNQDSLFVITSAGLFYSPVLNPSNISPRFLKVNVSTDFDGMADRAELGVDSHNNRMAHIYTGNSCLPKKVYNNTAYVSLKYRDKQSKIALYVSSGFPYTDWRRISINSSKSYDIIDIVFDYLSNSAVALVSVQNTRFVIFTGLSADLNLAFTFEKNTQLYGIYLLDMGGISVVYGDSVWISYDSSQSFSKLNIDMQPGEIIVDVSFLKTDLSLGFVSTNGRIFYLRMFSDGGLTDLFITPLPRITDLPMPIFRTVQFDSWGNILFTYIKLDGDNIGDATYGPIMKTPSSNEPWDNNDIYGTYIFPLNTVLEFSLVDQTLGLYEDDILIPYYCGGDTMQLYFASKSSNHLMETVFDERIKYNSFVFKYGTGLISQLYPRTQIRQVNDSYISSHGFRISLSGPMTPSVSSGDNAILSDIILDSNCQTAAQVSLKLNNPDDSVYWVKSNILSTVVMNAGSILITSIVSDSEAVGLVVFPPTACSAPSGSWDIFDFSMKKNYALAKSNDSIMITSNGLYFNATVTSGSFQFTEKHLFMFLYLGNDECVITEVIDGQRVKVIFPKKFNRVNQNITDWKIYGTFLGYESNLVPYQGFIKSWSIQPAQCPYSDFSSMANKDLLTYIDHGDSVTLGASLVPSNGPEIRTSISGSTNIINVFDEYVPMYPYVPRTLSINVTESVSEGVSQIYIFPQPYSLLCRQSLATATIMLTCPPSKYITEDFPYDIDLFLSGKEQTSNGDTASHDLPVNYRPPSKYGIAIPTSDNIYNADPSKEKHRNMLGISKDSGRFKQCAGKKNQEECNCSKEQKISWLEENSDCIQKVRIVYFSDIFKPEFLVYENGQKQKMSLPYRVKELNSRTDFCISSANSGGTCMGTESERELVLSPENHDGITFTGVELYHFRVEVVSGSKCDLITEIIVFVVDPPLSSLGYWGLVSCTVIGIAVLIFFGYLYSG